MSDTITIADELDAVARSRVAACASLAELDSLKVELLGKKGTVTAQLKALGALAPEARREAGAQINAVRDGLGAAIEARKANSSAPNSSASSPRAAST